MTLRWGVAVLAPCLLLPGTTWADKDRGWGAASAMSRESSGHVTGSCSTRRDTPPSIDARLTLWDEDGRMASVSLTLHVVKVKGEPGEFVFDAAFNPAEVLSGGAPLLNARLRLGSPDCDAITGSLLVEDTLSGTRHALPLS